MYGAGWVVIPGSPSHGVPKAIDTYLDSAAWRQSFVGVLQYQHLTARWFLDDLRANLIQNRLLLGFLGPNLNLLCVFGFTVSVLNSVVVLLSGNTGLHTLCMMNQQIPCLYKK